MTSAIDKLIHEQSQYIKEMGLDPEKVEHWDIALKVITNTKEKING